MVVMTAVAIISILVAHADRRALSTVHFGGRFFISPSATTSKRAFMTHRVGIVGGDGIGPDVIAEGSQGHRAQPASSSTLVDYDLGGERYLKDGVVLTDEIVDEWRGLDAIYVGAVGTPDVPPGVIERGHAPEDALRPRPLHQPAALRRREPRVHRHPREHRGHLRRRGWLPAQGHARGDRHPGFGQHPPRRRALHPLRLRARHDPAQAPHDVPQDQRA